MEPEAAGTLRLMIWNINSLVPTVRNFILKYGSFRGFFEEHSVQIACLQETKMLDDKLTKDLVCLEGYESFWATSREKKGYSGVTTYASTAYSPVKAEADCLGDGESDLDREGRVVLTDHMAFVLVNVYAPNAGERPERPRKDFKCRFLTALKAKCDSLRAKGREVLIVGDLNVAASQRDVHPKFSYEALYSEEENQAMHALLGEYTDVWRHRHPQDTSTYTVWDEKTSARAFNEGLRIDYALCTPGLLAKVVSCEVVQTPPKWSDHAAMVLELRDISPIAAHAPCALSSSRMKRFNDRGQPSVATMFGRKPASKRAAGLEAEQVPGASRKVSKQEGASAAAPESRTRPSATAPGQLDQPRLSAAKTTGAFTAAADPQRQSRPSRTGSQQAGPACTAGKAGTSQEAWAGTSRSAGRAAIPKGHATGTGLDLAAITAQEPKDLGPTGTRAGKAPAEVQSGPANSQVLDQSSAPTPQHSSQPVPGAPAQHQSAAISAEDPGQQEGLAAGQAQDGSTQSVQQQQPEQAQQPQHRQLASQHPGKKASAQRKPPSKTKAGKAAAGAPQQAAAQRSIQSFFQAAPGPQDKP